MVVWWCAISQQRCIARSDLPAAAGSRRPKVRDDAEEKGAFELSVEAFDPVDDWLA
jgi:hypothetical protein